MAQRGFNCERDTEQLLKYFEELTDDDLEAVHLNNVQEFEFILVPPTDGADSDRDDANSDDEANENLQLLGKKLLAETGEVRLNIQGTYYELPELVPPNIEVQEIQLMEDCPTILGNNNKKRKKTRNWTERDLEQAASSKLENDFRPSVVDEIIAQDMSPLGLFKIIFSEDFINQICAETTKYANLKGDLNFTVSADEMYKFIGILLLSGYNKLPSKRMFWEQQEDTFNILVTNAMSRNKFEKILRFIHFNDNAKIDPNNKLYKVQPLIEHFNEKFLELASII